MKWLVLVVFLIAVPLAYSMLASRKQERLAWSVFGFLPMMIQPWNLDVSLYSFRWAGYITGTEISIVDVLAMTIVANLGLTRVRGPYVWLFIIFSLVTLLSVFSASLVMPSVLGVWQTLRVLIIFLAAAAVSAQPGGPRAILVGMVAGLAVHAGYSIQEKLGGAVQAKGLYDHQNILGMASHFVTFPALALILANPKERLMYLGVASALTVAVLGASRGTILFAGGGYALLFALSMVRRPTKRKWRVAGYGAIALALMGVFAVTSLEKRFQVQTTEAEEYDERAAFESAARMMLSDHPFGVGANQYAVTANLDGYSDRAGVAWNSGSRGAHVHNAYLLTAAEMGWLGLAAFVALLFVPIFKGLSLAWSWKENPRGEMILGYVVTLVVVAIHNLYEWVFVTYAIQMLFAINLGAIAGLSFATVASQRKAKSRPGRRVVSDRLVNS